MHSLRVLVVTGVPGNEVHSILSIFIAPVMHTLSITLGCPYPLCALPPNPARLNAQFQSLRKLILGVEELLWRTQTATVTALIYNLGYALPQVTALHTDAPVRDLINGLLTISKEDIQDCGFLPVPAGAQAATTLPASFINLQHLSLGQLLDDASRRGFKAIADLFASFDIPSGTLAQDETRRNAFEVATMVAFGQQRTHTETLPIRKLSLDFTRLVHWETDLKQLRQEFAEVGDLYYDQVVDEKGQGVMVPFGCSRDPYLPL
ncbi:hypothetical protein HWV62_24370 [Athelia sp. TMB]|nr:hypothetical protein HWV62_24370 [Athelia sp. TMB]